MKIRPIVVVACVFAVLVAGCGQKPGVSEQISAGALPPGATVDPETGQIIDASGNVIGSTTDGSFDTGSLGSGTGTTGGGTTTTTTTGSGDPGDPGDPGDTPPPTGGDSTGVTGDTITIGAHAPLTGAAPVPSDSAEKGKDLYFRWMEDQKQRIFGRKVEVILRNDNYNPSQAVAVCKEMVEKDKVFLLSGSAGTDQIQACARYAASVGVPYMSAGVTEVGLSGLPNYFATTMTYPDQGPLMADMLVSDLGAKSEKNGMVRFETPNFQDAHDAFVNAMKQRGASIDYDRAVCKCATSTEAQTVVQELKAAGIENVNVVLSPLFFLQMLQAARTQQYTPQWTAVGIQMTFDTITSVGCRNGTIDKMKAFSPFPAWVDRDRFDPEFDQALQKFHSEECNGGNCGDDFMWLAWSGSKTLRSLFELTGKNLTREAFVYKVERARGLKNGIGPELNFSPDDRFGASQVHVSEARCSDARWHTLKTFVSDF